MGAVSLDIGGRSYNLACRDGEEDHLRRLAARVDAKTGEARAAVGSVNEVRLLLIAALLLADELDGAATGPAPSASPAAGAEAELEALAARIEAIADALERVVATP